MALNHMCSIIGGRSAGDWGVGGPGLEQGNDNLKKWGQRASLVTSWPGVCSLEPGLPV